MHPESFHSMTSESAATLLHTNLERGLTLQEATERTRTYGLNVLERESVTPGIRILLSQFTSPLIVVLIAASIVTILIGHYRDAVFILIAVFVNAALGFYQEHKAERAIAELRTYLRQRARVVRDGKETDVDAEHIVPGDLIRLVGGNRVPADARLVFATDVEVDEAVLTGESLPVEKSTEPSKEESALGDQRSMVFAGTLITQGAATALVTGTGGKTELGKIAALVESTGREETPLQKTVRAFSVKASAFLSALTVVVFIIGVLMGQTYLDMFLISVAIAVSAIPEGLPIALTVILAVGVERMARRKGVVRKLVAAETLGSTTVILTDKTGTLTMASMELAEVIALEADDETDVLKQAVLATSVVIENREERPEDWRMMGSIMERALVKAAALRGVDDVREKQARGFVELLPFNAVSKFSAVLSRLAERSELIFFGAADVLVERSHLNEEGRAALHARIEALAATGMRVLGVASFAPAGMGPIAGLVPDQGLTMQGFLAFRDPVRPGVPNVVARLEQADIRTVIVTGDHLKTAEAIAAEVGLPLGPGASIEAKELASLSDKELTARLAHLRVIARVTPTDKLRIVRAFQAQGEVVAMTGDGVNDAPSIRQADVGIAMGSGTEVSRSVADLVLLDDNFETIAAAVDEGRQIMANIRKVLVYLLSNVMDGLLLIGGALLLGIALPLNALQILWVNFFSDSFPAIAFAFEKEKDGLALRRHDFRKGLFDPLMRFLIIGVGLSSSAALLGLYVLLTKLGFDDQLVRTFVFACFGTYTLFVAFSVRSLDRSILETSPAGNRYLVAGVGFGLLLMAAAVYIPVLQRLFDTVSLPPVWLVMVGVVAVVNIAAIELGKYVYRKMEVGRITRKNT